MARAIVTIVIFSLFLFFLSTQSLDETLVSRLYTTDVVSFWNIDHCDPRYPHRPSYCDSPPQPQNDDKNSKCRETVSHIVENCGLNLIFRESARRECCNDFNSISDDCLDRNLKSAEHDVLNIVKTVCSDFVDHSSPKDRKQPPPAEAKPSPPPPKQQPPSDHNKRRPEMCLVDTVLYDSCDPKYPEANNKDNSYFDKGYDPHDVSIGITSDDAGCCLGFAVFTNDCNFGIKDLSFAKQRVFSRLKAECDKRS